MPRGGSPGIMGTTSELELGPSWYHDPNRNFEFDICMWRRRIGDLRGVVYAKLVFSRFPENLRGIVLRHSICQVFEGVS